MSCRYGFDPFGDRDARLVAHAASCAHCGEVLRVLDAGRTAWKHGLAQDKARAFYRERRLGRARPPARTAMSTLIFAVVLAALSGYALARRGGQPAEAPMTPPATVEPAPPPAPRVAPRTAPTSEAEPEPTVEPIEAPPPAVASSAPVETARELWDRAVTLLDGGDRVGAERAFRRVIDAPSTEPGLRSRATFRWAELLLSRGDTQTPRAPLFRLVRGADGALGFDAALLLERCAPDERARIWDAYLEHATDPTLRARAEQRR